MAEPRTLDKAPGALGLYARAVAPVIPGASHLPFVGGGGGDIPDVELRMDDLAIDAEHLAAYSKLCRFRLDGRLPVIYPNVIAFPLHMSVITDKRFPFPAVGLVHVRNTITQHRPIGSGEHLDLRVTPTPLQPHPKGRTFSIRTEASVAGEVVWEGESTMLRRGKADDDAARAPHEEDPAITPSAEWRLPGDLGRRYAAISGDINPIHLYDASAKLFGFKRAIIHGLWTKARALAAFEGRLPDAYTVDVRFRKPILLPATVAFGTTVQDGTRAGGISFAVQDARKGTPHLAGTIAERSSS